MLLEGSLYSHVEELWNETQAAMKSSSGYVPQLDPALEGCLRGNAGLAWWKSNMNS